MIRNVNSHSLAIMLSTAWCYSAVVADVTNAQVVRTSSATGVARFVTSSDGNRIPVALPAGRQVPEPLDFFRDKGILFGITDAERQLMEKESTTDGIGRTRTTFQQVHDGVPVFAGVLRVHTDAGGGIRAANGTFIPDLNVNTTPVWTADRAAEGAITLVTKQQPAAGPLRALANTLYVYRVNLARGIPGPDALVYEVEVGNGMDVRAFVYVDAHKGHVVDQVTGIHDSITRMIYDGGYDAGTLVWSEGDPPYAGGVVDVENLIEFSEDSYNLFSSATNNTYVSFDGADAVMDSIANSPFINCPNAAWNGTYTQYCPGWAADDVVAHEWTHAYTQYTHGLIYAWQPGALNESYSDIMGEIVDLLNGTGSDSPDVTRTAGDCSVFAGGLPALTIDAPPAIAGQYPASGAGFNPAPPLTVTADVELVNDGAGTVTDGCEPFVGFTVGNIALIDRGACTYVVKAINAANAGAVGVIIANNSGDATLFMTGVGAPGIPSVMIGQSSGDTIKTELPGASATIMLATGTANSYRWLLSEDIVSGAIRDMWNPSCFSDPGRVGDNFYYCETGDSGGVHTNSGVSNHAFALIVDGGTYNGQTINGIGLTKAFHIYWRAATTYQVPTSGFADHADFLEQSCADLIGVNLFSLSTATPIGSLSGEFITPADCVEVGKATLAVEFRTEPTFCAFAPMLDPNTPDACGAGEPSADIFREEWESGLGSWTVGTRAVANPATFDTPDWAVVGSLPDGRAGSAAFVADIRGLGDCGADTEAGVLYLESPVIAIPAGANDVRLAFDHWVATELGWDGVNVKISVNGGVFTVIPSASFTFNGYNGVLNASDNPLGGEEAFTGANDGSLKGSWGQSQINLAGIAAAGDDIQLRCEMGLDGCNGLVGWYLDDVRVYECLPDCNGNGTDDAVDIANCAGDPACSDCNANGTPDECDLASGNPTSQWASYVIDFSSQYSDSDYAAAQALGAPDTFAYGDIETAWAPGPDNGTLEYVTVGYPTPVYATGATIRETFGNGMVYQVDVVDTNDVLHTVWTGTDPSQPGTPVDYLVTWPTTGFLVKGIKVYTDTDHDLGAWEEIDAIALHGTGLPSPDCNANGTPDECELEGNDCNANGTPDECDVGLFTYTIPVIPPAPILDFRSAIHTFTVPAVGSIQDVDVGVTLTHTSVSDLNITVTDGGTGIILFRQQCGSEDNFVGTVFDDEAVGPIACVADHVGTFRPWSPLSIYDGREASGDWSISVFDLTAGNEGSLTAWSLRFKTSGPSLDCNANGTPDECEPDCNTNGIADGCDLAAGTSADCNANSVPDSCDISIGASLDCNATTMPDDCETIAGGDFDADGTVGLDDLQSMVGCVAGPEATPTPSVPACVSACLAAFDFDGDGDVDLADFKAFQIAFAP